ncbi:MAG: trypsin-like peptidase domain-containing protein [Clostridiales bacterium]|nr:trypsin-like peptidase domain-containing protein [Clostridiales bacterium]
MNEYKDENLNNNNILPENTASDTAENSVFENSGSEISKTEEIVEEKPVFTAEETENPIAETAEVTEAVKEETAADSAGQGESLHTEGINRGVYYDEKSAALLKPETTEKKKNKNLKQFAAFAAGVAVVFCAITAGSAAGSYLYKNGGVAAASGADITLGSGGSEDVLPIIYTTNFSSISEVFKSVEASVVNISMTANTTNIWNQTYETSGSGSGIIYKVDGDDVYIATNNHVVDGATSVSVSITGDEQVFATLVGKDAENDLAVIKVSKQALIDAGVSEVKAAEFVSSDSTEIGETVLAIGNALGEGKSVTMGIISAKNKDISVDGNNLTVLQTDAAINPGNSGGALVNLDGQVIGINTAKTGSESVEGTGYAIPSYVAVSVIDQLIENGTVEKPYLGVVCFTITDNFRQMYNIDLTGVFIQEVSSGSAAEKAGLRATDIITAVNGTAISSQEDLQNIISGLSVGDSITIDFVRNGREEMSTTAVLENYNEF